MQSSVLHAAINWRKEKNKKNFIKKTENTLMQTFKLFL